MNDDDDDEHRNGANGPQVRGDQQMCTDCTNTRAHTSKSVETTTKKSKKHSNGKRIRQVRRNCVRGTKMDELCVKDRRQKESHTEKRRV